MRKILLSFVLAGLCCMISPTSVGAEEVNIQDVEEEYETEVVYVDDGMSDQELLEEMERLENAKEKAAAMRTRSNLGYTVKLEYYTDVDRDTGFKVAGGQPSGGTNFGSSGGSFGYTDGNGSYPTSISFGISGYGVSFSVGVGSKASAGVNGYNINAPKNKAVKLYVNKTARVTIYKRYKIITTTGQKVDYGYAHTAPRTHALKFQVK